MKTHSIKSILQLFLLNLVVSESTKTELPKKIGEYSLLREIPSELVKKQHKIGIYRNGSTLSVAKVWHGRKSDAHLASLEHEAYIYRSLQKITSRTKSILPPELSNISIPKFLLVKKSKTSFALLTEFSNGVSLRTATPEQKREGYEKATAYLKFLSGHMTQDEFNSFPVRGKLELLMIYPYVFLTAFLQQKKQRMQFISGIPYIFLAILLMSRKKEFSLIHRDLHGDNILFDGVNYVILDFQRLVLGPVVLEFGPSLGAEWNDKIMRNVILSEMRKAIRSRTDSLITKGSLLLFATHALTADNLPEQHLEKYRSVLSFALSSKIKKERTL